MTKIEKTERIQEVKKLVQAFYNRHLNEELAGVWGHSLVLQFPSNPFKAGS
jgi:hypothetical protein